MKVFAPVITYDVTLPDSNDKEPMVMVPVPYSRTLMGIPISTLSQLNETHIMDSLKDEQQARDLLIWKNGVGVLDGCDLRFKINQLGCLELLDSDDDEENQNSKVLSNNNNNNGNNTNNNTQNNRPSLVSNKQTKQSNNSIQEQQQHIGPIVKEISPGSSLLMGGPKTKRPKSSNSAIISTNTLSSPTTRSQTPQNHYHNHHRQQLNPSTRQTKPSQLQPQSQQLQQIQRPEHQQLSQDLLNVPGNKSILLELPTALSEQNKKSLILNKLLSKHKLQDSKTLDNVQQWTIEDVKIFIDSIPGCSGCGELFESQQICGKSLMYLKQKDLLDVINIKLGPAVKIYHAISLLK